MKIGIQMFSLRNYTENEGIEKTFDVIAQCGFDCIEPVYNDYGIGLENVGKLMRKNNLVALSAHTPIQVLLEKDELKRVRDIFGLKTAVIPCIARDVFYDEKRLREVLLPAIDNATELGLDIAYHNHNFEFEQGDILGSLPLKFPPLKLQPDVFWLQASGFNPKDYLLKHKNYISVIHLKEFGQTQNDENPVVGKGKTDAESILKFALAQKHESIILEFENPEYDDVTYMEKSIESIREVIKK